MFSRILRKHYCVVDLKKKKKKKSIKLYKTSRLKDKKTQSPFVDGSREYTQTLPHIPRGITMLKVYFKLMYNYIFPS